MTVYVGFYLEKKFGVPGHNHRQTDLFLHSIYMPRGNIAQQTN